MSHRTGPVSDNACTSENLLVYHRSFASVRRRKLFLVEVNSLSSQALCVSVFIVCKFRATFSHFGRPYRLIILSKILIKFVLLLFMMYSLQLWNYSVPVTTNTGYTAVVFSVHCVVEYRTV
jgi:hypothetical protein